MANDRKDRFAKAQVDEVKVVAPYAFVDMAPFVVPTPWDCSPRHDKPHPEGISGEFTVRWTAESPILVGGDGAGAESFFRLNPHDEASIALPGSTLRGAVRALLEAMTSARLEHIDRNAVFSVRDFSSGRDQINRWQQAIKAFRINGLNLPGTLKAGFLRKDSAGWHLQQADWTLVHTGKILQHFKSKATEEKFERSTVAQKYALLGDHAHLSFDVEEGGNAIGAAIAPTKRKRPARLILSGVDPKVDLKGAKKKEAVFFTTSEHPAFLVCPDDIARFEFIHSAVGRGSDESAPRGALAYWQDALASGQVDSIPVFWIDARQQATDKSELPSGIIMSLARSMKIPFRQSVGQVLEAQRAEAMKDPSLDLVQALFGHVPHEGADSPPIEGLPRQSAWRGRVQFADAPVTRQSVWEAVSKSGVMGQPRPSFWPYYLRPERDGDDVAPADWSTAGANLAGFKRYPVRKTQSNFIQPTNGNENTSSEMNFIVAKPNRQLAFDGRIRVHNLLPEELGALVFALCFGPPGTETVYRHAIGRAKPQGYGRVKARIVKIDLLATNTGASMDSTMLANAISAFQRHVSDAYNARAGTTFSFPDIPCVADTLAIQNPEIGEAVKNRLVYPTGRPKNDASPVVAGYTTIKSAAAQGDPKAKLPRYPHKP